MPVANTGVSAYGWWRSSSYIKTLHADFPQLEVDQIIEAVRVAGPEDAAVREHLLQQSSAICVLPDVISKSTAISNSSESLTTIFNESGQVRLIDSCKRVF